jgi:hypothetical protein
VESVDVDSVDVESVDDNGARVLVATTEVLIVLMLDLVVEVCKVGMAGRVPVIAMVDGVLGALNNIQSLNVKPSYTIEILYKLDSLRRTCPSKS